MGLVLLPIDQDTERALAQQLVCWARGENGMIDSRVTYQSNASVGDERVGSYLVPGAVCSEYGPVPFTSGGQPIPCDAGPWLHPYFVRRTDVEPIDTDTCRRGGSGFLSLSWEPDAEVMLAVTVTASGAPRMALDFGDGTTVSAVEGEPVRHVYAAAGAYTVTASAAEHTAAVEAVTVKDHAPKVFVFVDGSDDWRALLWINEPTSDAVYAVDWDDWSNPAPTSTPASPPDYPRIAHQYTHHGYYKIKVTDTSTRRASVVDFEAGQFGIDFSFGTDNVTPTATVTAMRAGATWQLDWGDGTGVKTGTVPNSGILKIAHEGTMPDGTYRVQVREIVDGVRRRGDSRDLRIPWTNNGELKATVKWLPESAAGRIVRVTPTDATAECTIDWGDGSPTETVANKTMIEHAYQGAPPADGWLLVLTEPGSPARHYQRLIAEPTYVGPPILGAWRKWSVDLHIAGVDDNRNLDWYQILWGDGLFDDAGARGWWTNARHRYAGSGTYNIKVNGPGMADRIVQTVVVPTYPTPRMYLTEDKSDLTRTTAIANIDNPDCGGDVTIDWGDGTTGNAAESSKPTHQFAPGEYTVIVSCNADPTAQERKNVKIPFGS